MKILKVILLGGIFILPMAAHAACGGSTRENIETLRCDDPSRSAWYALEVNEMCGTLSGKQQPMIEIVDVREGFQSQEKGIFRDQVASLISGNKGKKVFKLFSKRAGKAGVLQAYAMVSPDGKSISKIRLYIQGQDKNDKCTKDVDVSHVWSKTYSDDEPNFEE